MDLLSSVLRRPVASDDKYSRGVVGFVTGSTEFPGAAILGVTAAIRTGVGMVRWLGPEAVGRMLIEVRPEVVLQNGRVQCWVLGSGVSGDVHGEQFANVAKALAEPGFAVIDAGALELANFEELNCQAILTPHAGELERLLSSFAETLSRAEIEAEPETAAKLASRLTGQVVLLKGNVTTIADPAGGTWQTPPASPALATAGSGDVLAGILGALVAANVGQLNSREISLSQIALAGALLHARAGAMAAQDGPVAALDIAEALRAVVGEYLA
jgi:hydroxyethylthiazole kinase-like uncharacterized protein yjeF